MSDLIEGLPDAVALKCLAYVPYYFYSKLQLVSRSWRAAIHSAELFIARNEIGLSEDLLCVSCYDPDNIWQLYDPIQNHWLTLPKLPSKRSRLAYFGAVSTSHKLFVIGGGSDTIDPSTGNHDEDFSTNEVWSFDFVTRKWSIRAPMLVARSVFACCVLDGKIVVAGGLISSLSSKSTSTAEMYDPEIDLWTPLPDLPQVQDSSCVGIVIGGKMHVMHMAPSSTVQIFDKSELKWRVEEYGWLSGYPMAVVGDSIYVMSQGLIFKQDEHVRRQIFCSVDQFHRRMGMAMISVRDEIYMIGGVMCPARFDEDIIKLSDVHVLWPQDDQKQIWRRPAPMTRCRGTVLGCAHLRI